VTEQARWVQNRYHLIDLLGEGGMGTVWRAHDRLSGSHVALKQVRRTPSEQSADTPANLALAREFQTLSTLRHPHIISVLDYGFDDGHPYLTMTLMGGVQTLSPEVMTSVARKPHEVLLDILAALTYLHRRGVVHCDLKPSNVVLESDGSARLIDFGIASAPSDSASPSGTVNYLAPELMTGASLSASADLYAVGVMAYEFYAGRHPFDNGDVSGLLARMLYDSPDLTPLLPALRPWVDRLLKKQPHERYASAGEAVTGLCDALDIPLPMESVDIRESFLQSARFVGREHELSTLTTALKSTCEGQGTALLISGESGVGKSRLMNELRVQALVSGARVVRGQAVEGGGLPYQLWRDIVPTLLLDAQPSERDSAALSLIVPDIAHLTGYTPPKRLRKDAHQRIPAAVSALLRAQTRPLVLLFEDVQWAGESLSLLQDIIPLTGDRPLLVVATHRFDEQPSLPPELDACQVMRLERLTPTDIQDLCGAMLGEVGRSVGLVAQLQRETEGNVFFLVEVVRALAEDSGRLEDIDPATLLKSRLTGGILALMQRRIGRLPDWARPLLTLAAVAGRRLDSAVLGRLSAPTAPSLADWLTVCADAALIDVTDGAWRFRHDKIRESLLADITPPEAAMLHGQVAAAIEQVYAGDSAYAATLALHWADAGDWARAMDNLRAAVWRWRGVSAYQEAQALLHQMVDKAGDADSAERAELLTFLGEMYIEVGAFTESQAAYSAALAICQRLDLPTLLPSALVGVTYFEYRTGSLQTTIDMLEQVLGATQADPLTRIRALNLKTIIYDALPPEQAKAALDEALALSEQHDLLDGRLLTYQNLGPYYLFNGDTLTALRVMREMAELAELSGNNAMASAAYINMAEVYLGERDAESALPLIERLTVLLELTGDLFLGAWIWKTRAQVHEIAGDMPAAIADLEEAVERFVAIGATSEVAFARAWLVSYQVRAGQALAAAAHLPVLLSETQQIDGVEQTELTLAAYALVAMAMGDTAQAADWRVALNQAGQSLRGAMVMEMILQLDTGLDPEDLTDAAERARYADMAAALASLADSGW